MNPLIEISVRLRNGGICPVNDFPADFVWGAATASYQIEGSAREDGRGVSIWDTFSATPGNVANGDTGLVACDHYQRFADDIQVMKDLGIRAYRFSISWTRLFPNGDSVREERGFNFYNRLIDALIAADIEPVVTVYHWDLPQALEDRGGWANRSIVPVFAQYAAACAEAFGDRVKTWITINEPWCVSWLGYQLGIHAPGKKDVNLALAAAHHTALAHAAAARSIKAVRPDAQVGLTVNMTNIRVSGENPDTLLAADLIDAMQNRWWIDALVDGRYPQVLVDYLGDRYHAVVSPDDLAELKTNPDFLGINYYHDGFLSDARPQDDVLSAGGLLPFDIKANSDIPVESQGNLTDMEWPITPEGLGHLLQRVHREWPSIPYLVVTENGAAYDDAPDADGEVNDVRRIDYLKAHIDSVGQALEAGVPVKGYFAWSLLDNFEWSFGYAKRFGLVYVDFVTQKRTIKNSGREYAKIISGDRSRV